MIRYKVAVCLDRLQLGQFDKTQIWCWASNPRPDQPVEVRYHHQQQNPHGREEGSIVYKGALYSLYSCWHHTCAILPQSIGQEINGIPDFCALVRPQPNTCQVLENTGQSLLGQWRWLLASRYHHCTGDRTTGRGYDTGGSDFHLQQHLPKLRSVLIQTRSTICTENSE